MKAEAFDLFAVERTFGEQECAADATGDAVIPARDGYVDELRASHRHGAVPRVIGGSYQKRQPVSILRCVSFPLVWVRPNGQVIRLGPKVPPSGGGKPYNPRVDADGNLIGTHNPPEFISPISDPN